MFKNKTWFGSWSSSKPKNPHSIEHLKYLCNVMSKNQIVTEQNKTLLVETLRSIAEILIWGDQNDSTVFDFFLEKNMLSFFLKIMKQKCGSYVCVQLLQTLNILFENIRNETSLYYLLSNNHVNSIIVHKFDFSDEEVMAYYISFLKTLSLKLNAHTIHFFFNEHTNDFPLYTEAIKFFNHSEKMVRIAVRTLTLNVFKIKEPSMLKFVGDRTAAPYFSNLVWFIGNHVLEVDACLEKPIKDQQMLIKLDDLVAEHLDHLHYLNDILLLRINDLNQILTDHLLNRLFIPLYVYSLINQTPCENKSDRPRISRIVSLFLLSQVFLILSYESLVQTLVDIILNGKLSIFDKPEFSAPSESLEESLVQAARGSSGCFQYDSYETNNFKSEDAELKKIEDEQGKVSETDKSETSSQSQVKKAAITDEEKAAVVLNSKKLAFQEDKPFLNSLFNSLYCNNSDDHSTIFALCLIHAMINNKGIDENQLINSILPNRSNGQIISEDSGCSRLIDQLIEVMHLSCQQNNRIRLITLEMSILLLNKMIIVDGKSILPDSQLASIEQAKEEAAFVLRNYFKSEEETIFLDLFEEENYAMIKNRLNVEYLMMDANLLLPPTLLIHGLELTRRLPCADVERARCAIRVFLLLRQLSLNLRNLESTSLLSVPNSLVKIDQLLDLSTCDLIACVVIMKDQPKMKRFMVIDSNQFILIEPDNTRFGWGITKFVAFLQDVEISGDKEDSRSLLATIRSTNNHSRNKKVITNAQFIFDDHIRCMAAKQRLTKGRMKIRQKKMMEIAKLIDLDTINELKLSRKSASFSNRDVIQSQPQVDSSNKRHHYHSHPNNMHRTICRGSAVPGFAVAHNEQIISPPSKFNIRTKSNSSTSDNSNQEMTSRDSSPRRGSNIISHELIQMENLSPKSDRLRNKSQSENRSNNSTSIVQSKLDV